MSRRHLQYAFKFYKPCAVLLMKEFVLLSGLGHNLESEWFGLEETLSISSHSNGQGQIPLSQVALDGEMHLDLFSPGPHLLSC